MLVNEFAVEVLRPGVIDKLKEIVGRVVADPERRKSIVCELDGFRNAEDYLPDDEDLLLVVRHITLFPDNHIEAELVDRERISRKMRSYSPSKGWYGV